MSEPKNVRTHFNGAGMDMSEAILARQAEAANKVINANKTAQSLNSANLVKRRRAAEDKAILDKIDREFSNDLSYLF